MYRSMLVIIGLVATSWVPPTKAAEPLDVIKKAIDAHGGAENLKKSGVGTASGKITVQIGAAEVRIEFTVYSQQPDNFRMDAEIVADDERIKLIQVFNGKQGWQKVGDTATATYNDGQLKAMRTNMQVEQAALLTPLLDTEKYRVEQLFGEFEVNGKKTVAINVKNDNGLDATFHFDPESHLIVKQEFPTVNFFTGKEALQEVFLSEYKRFDGVMVPTRNETRHDGKFFMSGTKDHVQFDEQLDANLFEKPQ